MVTFESNPHTVFILQHICTQTHTINSRRIRSRLPLAVHAASVCGCAIKVFSCSSPKCNKCKTHCLRRFAQTYRFTHKCFFLQSTSSVLISSAQAEKVQLIRRGFLASYLYPQQHAHGVGMQVHPAIVQHSKCLCSYCKFQALSCFLDFIDWLLFDMFGSGLTLKGNKV